MPRQHLECSAIVLAEQDHGESDRIITFLSKEMGRFTGIAKGAKRSKRRFVNKLELFTSLSVTCSRRDETSLAFIHDADLLESFLALRSNVNLYYTASVLRELLLLGTLDGQGDDQLFSLFHWGLTALNDRRDAQTILSIFLIRYLDQLGYCPNLTHCQHCGAPLTSSLRYFFHPGLAGLFCEKCARLSEQTYGNRGELSLGTLRLLNSARYEPLERLHRLRFSAQARFQALQALYRFSRALFQHDIQAWKILRTLGNNNAPRTDRKTSSRYCADLTV